MAVLNIYDLAGNQTGTVEVNEAVFGIEPNKTVLHEVLTAELAAARQGTAATKTRAMVRGGGRKPFKQKGTGRARDRKSTRLNSSHANISYAVFCLKKKKKKTKLILIN